MQSLGKHRNWISSGSLGAAAIARVFASTLTIVGAQTAQAQAFTEIHTFTGGMDGAAPEDTDAPRCRLDIQSARQLCWRQ
jgi:hypothetical protein